jgi:hypothetical protein
MPSSSPCKAMRNAFCRRMGSSPNTSARDATGSLPQCIVRRWVNDARSGEKSQGWRLPHTCHAGYGGLPPGLVMVLKHINLTTPMTDNLSREAVVFIGIGRCGRMHCSSANLGRH